MSILRNPREDIAHAAESFLRAVATAIKQEFGRFPLRTQTSRWWSTGLEDGAGVRHLPSQMTARMHSREIPDQFAVSTYTQLKLFDTGLTEEAELTTTLEAIGVEKEVITYSFLLPLIAGWYKLADPGDLSSPSVQKLIQDFTEAVVSNSGNAKHTDFVVDLVTGPLVLVLEPGISLRRISEEELWSLGEAYDMQLPEFGYRVQATPRDDWSVLEIEALHRLDQPESLNRPGKSGGSQP